MHDAVSNQVHATPLMQPDSLADSGEWQYIIFINYLRTVITHGYPIKCPTRHPRTKLSGYGSRNDDWRL